MELNAPIKRKKKNLLYSTGNSTHCALVSVQAFTVMAYMRKQSKKEWIYVELIHCGVHLKLTQHCKSALLQ